MEPHQQNLVNFFENPMGKGSTAIPNRKIIMDYRESKYYALTKKEDLECNVYKDGDDYYFHVLIPSEVDGSELKYDVVIRFYQLVKDHANTLHNYMVQFFSNCPSFTYTYAHVYSINGLLIESLSDKYDDIVMSDKPKIRNRSLLIHYDKSIFYACKYILDRKHLMDKNHLEKIKKKSTVNSLSKKIKNTDKVMIIYKKEYRKIADENKRERENKKLKKLLTEPLKKKRASTKSTITKKSSVRVIKPKAKIGGRKKR